jgi:hypothetical protein
VLLVGLLRHGGELLYRALSMGSAILWGLTISRVKWVSRDDLGIMGAAMWLAAGAPVPSPSMMVGGSGVRESGLMLPIAVSRQEDA